ncbi:MAG: hypothetical protein AVDCRST_MAG64-3477, partial [uncultured Phycisphaerae bacterium]
GARREHPLHHDERSRSRRATRRRRTAQTRARGGPAPRAAGRGAVRAARRPRGRHRAADVRRRGLPAQEHLRPAARLHRDPGRGHAPRHGRLARPQDAHAGRRGAGGRRAGAAGVLRDPRVPARAEHRRAVRAPGGPVATERRARRGAPQAVHLGPQDPRRGRAPARPSRGAAAGAGGRSAGTAGPSRGAGGCPAGAS